MIIDLTTDAGFNTLIEMIKEGKLAGLDNGLDVDALVEKQAYADEDTFADPANKQFSIASANETLISACYAEKCASDMEQTVLDALNEACVVYGIEPVKVAKKTLAPNEMFPEEAAEAEKYAGCSDYGTELDTCLAARALMFPQYAEELEGLAKQASELEPNVMVNVIRDFDAEVGADLPWIQQKIGTPEYAVFEKRAEDISVDLGTKLVSFEKIAESTELFDMFGVEVDFNEDPYTIKLAVERLPNKIKEAIANHI